MVNSNPIKLREYLAMGKPIVSVSIPEIDKFSDYVATARTPEEFLAKLDRAVAEGLSPEARARQTALAADDDLGRESAKSDGHRRQGARHKVKGRNA